MLDIETDGSITPREALASAGDTLRSLVAARRRDERRAAGPRARRGQRDHGAGSPDLDLPIEDLDLSERPRNCLKRAQVNTIGELLEKTEDDLLAITNFGQKSLDEVIAEARRARPVAPQPRTEDRPCLQPHARAAASAATPPTRG